jgi:hypothetical protein
LAGVSVLNDGYLIHTSLTETRRIGRVIPPGVETPG